MKEIFPLQMDKGEAIDFIAKAIAHDFNNLLHTISGNAEIISLFSQNDRTIEAARRIISACEVGSIMVRRLILLFDGRNITQKQLVDLNREIKNTLNLIKTPNSIDFKLFLEPNLPLIYADPTEISEIIMNLVVNAQEAMPEGGKIEIKTGLKTLDSWNAHANVRPGKFVSIIFSDSGHGIPEQVLSRLFDPFFSTKQTKTGRGLGLAKVFL